MYHHTAYQPASYMAHTPSILPTHFHFSESISLTIVVQIDVYQSLATTASERR